MGAVDWLTVGRIGSPFGVKGWVHVESYTDPPQRLLDYRSWGLRSGSGEPNARQLAEAREHGNGLIARLEGVEDRNAAALLQGVAIEVARSALPPLRAQEFYQADLIGLAVMNLQGIDLGVVRHFIAAPAGPVMVVQQGGREHWVPATRQHLNRVDLAAGRVVVDWPAELE
jgi:16S rRNA processing protein RimM